jgi:hypothetical protein
MIRDGEPTRPRVVVLRPTAHAGRSVSRDTRDEKKAAGPSWPRRSSRIDLIVYGAFVNCD